MPLDSEHGVKTAAGMLLTKYLRDIGLERTETNGGLDPKDGKNRMITKAEALARTIWKLALGYEEKIRRTTKDGKIKEVAKYHPPEAKFVDIVYDRLEGKVGMDKDSVNKRPPMSGKVEAQAKARLNDMVKENPDDGQGI
jgi:hypothetical protein